MKCKGAYVRSREKWLEQGENVQSIFYSLRNKEEKKRELHYIEKDGNRIVNSEDILKNI